MRRGLDALVAGAALAAATCGAAAHHSKAMFDEANPIELVGVVREFKFVSPHTLIVFEVKGEDNTPSTWSLEGNSPNSLVWSGWSNKTLKPGDELRITIEPLRSGAPGGAWSPSKVRFKDGSPIVTTH